MRGRVSPVVIAALAAALACGTSWAEEPEPEPEPGGSGGDLALEAEAGPEPESERDAVGVDEDILARSDNGRSIMLLVETDGSQSFADIARRVAGDPRRGAAIAGANDADPVVGFIGAIIGTWLARELQLPDPFVIAIRGTSYNILWTIIGAVIFTAALSLITPGKNK